MNLLIAQKDCFSRSSTENEVLLGNLHMAVLVDIRLGYTLSSSRSFHPSVVVWSEE